MNVEEIAEHAKQIVSCMVKENFANKALSDILRKYVGDESISGGDIVQILGASLVFMAQSMDHTATQAIRGVMQCLTLLYADKSPEELLSMAVSVLAEEEYEDYPRVRVVFMNRQRDD